jgi:hypothetical protein
MLDRDSNSGLDEMQLNVRKGSSHSRHVKLETVQPAKAHHSTAEGARRHVTQSTSCLSEKMQIVFEHAFAPQDAALMGWNAYASGFS